MKRLVLIILIIFLSSCSLNRVLGYNKDEFLLKIASGDHDFLNEVDYLETGIDEIKRLGEGASYYMSFIYYNMGKNLISNKLLYQEIEDGSDYFKEKAVEQLLKQLLQEKDYVKAELYALSYIEKRDPGNPVVLKKLIEALYWQKKDSLVVPYIDNLDRSNYSNYSNYELDLMKSVSSARLNKSDWVEQYKNLYFNQALSPILVRAYSFIDYYPKYAEPFTKAERSYFRAMALASDGSYNEALNIILPLLNRESWLFSTKQAIKNVSKIVKNTSYSKIKSSLNPFSSAVSSSSPEMRSAALVSFASLYYEMQWYSSVVKILRDEIDSMPLGRIRDDAIYLYLQSLSHSDSSRVVSSLEHYLDYIEDEGYTDVIIDYVITALVQAREWDSIERLYQRVKKERSVVNRSRVSWIISRLYYHGFLNSSNRVDDITALLDDIVTRDSSSYYSYISNALLNRESNLVLPDSPDSGELTEDDMWIDGFLTYGLSDRALEFFKQVDSLDYSVAINVAKELDRQNMHLEALRFMGRSGIPLNKESFPIYYTLPYKEKIVSVAESYDFPYTMFSGLIKNESGFDQYVVSRAGAVGLTQLMPETASEQAYNLGLGEFDIHDPETNILLGGKYMSWLIGKFSSLPLSAMAYNAGPGTLWNWQKKWGDLPDELFIEAAPYKETRNYVPKIVTYSIYYGHKEFGKSPYTVVTEIFENID